MYDLLPPSPTSAIYTTLGTVVFLGISKSNRAISAGPPGGRSANSATPCVGGRISEMGTQIGIDIRGGVISASPTPSSRAFGTPPASLRAPGTDLGVVHGVSPIEGGRGGRGQRPVMPTIVTPDMDTPHILQRHPDTIDPEIVPQVGMTFRSVDGAYWFYCRYAKEIGFGVKKYREKANCK